MSSGRLPAAASHRLPGFVPLRLQQAEGTDRSLPSPPLLESASRTVVAHRRLLRQAARSGLLSASRFLPGHDQIDRGNQGFFHFSDVKDVADESEMHWSEHGNSLRKFPWTEQAAQ